MSLDSWHSTQSRGNIATAAAASAAMATLISAGTPPFAIAIAIAIETMPAARLRATVGCIFALGAAFPVVISAVLGRFTPTEVVLTVALLPSVLIVFGVSGWVNRKLLGLVLRPNLLRFAAFGALAVLVKYSP